MPASGRNIKPRLAAAVVSILVLAGCALPIGKPAAPTSEAAATEITTPTAVPPRTLTVCLGEEPNTLFPYANPNDAALSVLAAIDDGPINAVSDEYQPVILSKLPSVAAGDAMLSKINVKAGDTIVDTDGNITALTAGTHLRPASCRADSCAITYDGISPLQMDQMAVTFTMRTDLTWSDGTPVTADDSVFGYEVAKATAPTGSRFLLDHTLNYESTGANTTQWWGLPGYIDTSFMTNFWAPAPKHAWSQFKMTDLPQIDVASRVPIGWGPYMIQNWKSGDRITLVKNPYFFRAAEGYPKFDELVFRFIADANTAISELTAGNCDILDPSVHLDE